ncbi:hypothetical protein ABT095_24650 [Kitasatospora sp. NPDC002227]|uniref:hypothetical protein n=1 Tax=Kitasatospora sp. NPDC002227 TaxID=3154773 RepID=UPI00332F0643
MPTESPQAAVDRLLTDLDPLAHPDRMRELAAWARADSARPLLDELAGRGSYGHRLAVVAAAVSGDVPFLADRLADHDAVVRSQALKASLRLPVADAAFERAMDDAPAAVRRQLATAVVRGGRTALAERLLPTVREQWGDEEAARLLPGCGPEAVARLLPELFLAVTRWRALGRCHPDPVLDEVARQLADLPEQARTPWWYRNGDVFAAVAATRPLRVLGLLELHSPAQLPVPVRGVLGHLLKAAPGRTLRLLTAPERHAHPAHTLLSRTALSRAARLGPPELLDLGRARSHDSGALARLLRALPPSRREAFYDAVTAGQDLSRSSLGEQLLDALPRRRAQTEARRTAEQAAERGEPWAAVLAAVAHLPVADARPRLLAATRRPAAEDRAQAYPLLVRNVARARDGAAVPELLADLERLRNEQEPVRTPALAALAELPPALLTAADAAALGRITTAALEARDSSWRTWPALTDLALAVLREHAASGRAELIGWALRTLEQLSGRTGALLGRLDTALRRGQEHQVFEALRPWLEAKAGQADHTLTLALARALGRRAHRLPGLQELLWQAVRSGNDSAVRQAVDLWLEAPATRAERALRVLELEPSAAVLRPVLNVLARRRTDLLHLVLGDTPPYGRFLTPGSRWLPSLYGIGRWTPGQQAAAARLLKRAADDASLPKHTRAGHLRTAVTVPGLGLGIVRRYLDSPDTVLGEAALGALVWADRPADALPLLLAHAADDRARVALYAAARAARFVRPSELEQVLRTALFPTGEGAPTAKVTSRKELVRLAATTLPVATAAELLAEAFGLPGQHRDVQAACVTVAVDLLRSPAAWQLLEDAADGPPVCQAALLRARPYELREEDRPRYARLVGQVTRSEDRETADAALGLLAGWAPWHPEAAGLLLARAVDLGNRTAWRSAADGLVTLAAAPDGAGPLLAALGELVAADAGDPDAEAERDRPARQRVDHLVARLTTAVTMRREPGYRTAALSAAELLGADSDFLAQGTRLSATALALEAPPAELLTALRRLAGRHTDRPALAARTAETLRHRLSTARGPGDPLALLHAAERLTADGDHAGGLLAVALTQALGTRTTWPDEWRTRLRALRRHPLPDVREAALSLATATE